MKKFLSTLLAFVMIFTATVPAFADNEDDGDVRVTHFFTEQHHTDENYEDIKNGELPDADAIVAQADEIRALLEDAGNAEEVKTRFLAFKDDVYHFYGCYQILSITYDCDTTNTEVRAAKNEAYMTLIDLFDVYSTLLRDILLSPCDGPVREMMIDADIAYYTDYVEMTDEERALSEASQALEDEYDELMEDDSLWTATYEGKEYTYDDIVAAYRNGEMDVITANRLIYTALYLNDKAVETVAELYTRIVENNNKIAQLAGYDNYAEYAYPNVYRRDYTVEDSAAFCDAVKEYLIPELVAYEKYAPYVDTDKLPENVAFSGVGMFETLKKYFGKMSSELLESMMYVYEHGAYDVDPAPHKNGTAYSTDIHYWDMCFYYHNSDGNYRDILTAIHELGHNNKAYWSSNDWNAPDHSYDVAEVHSQGLEMLMTHYYSDLFGSQAKAVEFKTVYEIMDNSIRTGCLYDELQRYAYTTPGLTAEQICQKARDLAVEYGYNNEKPMWGKYGLDATEADVYGNYWVYVPHTFQSPMYYISYATSGAGALAFWQEAQDDFFGAVDHYLEYSTLSWDTPFQETFKSTGMESPITPEYIKKVAETMHELLLSNVGPFEDVRVDAWYADYINFCYQNAIVNGMTDTTFNPDGTTTREQGMTILARIFGEEDSYTLEEGVAWAVENEVCDGSDPSGLLTREDIALMLYNLAVANEYDTSAVGDLTQFPDADTVSADRLDAVTWAVGAGLINGMDGKLNPQGTTTRAQFAALIYRFCNAFVLA